MSEIIEKLEATAKKLEDCCICYDVRMSEKPCCPPKCTPVIEAQKLRQIIFKLRQQPDLEAEVKGLKKQPRCPCGEELEALGWDNATRSVVWECKGCQAQIEIEQRRMI